MSHVGYSPSSLFPQIILLSSCTFFLRPFCLCAIFLACVFILFTCVLGRHECPSVCLGLWTHFNCAGPGGRRGWQGGQGWSKETDNEKTTHTHVTWRDAKIGNALYSLAVLLQFLFQLRNKRSSHLRVVVFYHIFQFSSRASSVKLWATSNKGKTWIRKLLFFVFIKLLFACARAPYVFGVHTPQIHMSCVGYSSSSLFPQIILLSSCTFFLRLFCLCAIFLACVFILYTYVLGRQESPSVRFGLWTHFNCAGPGGRRGWQGGQGWSKETDNAKITHTHVA